MSFIDQWLNDSVPALIGGQWRKGKATFAVDNPATGETIARVAELGGSDTEDAVAAAYEAGPGWRATPVKERARILRRWFELILEHADDLARLMTLEQGKPLAEAKGEVGYGASFIEFFAEEAKRMAGETLPSHGADKRILVTREPVGVVAAITPWNFPLAMITRKCAPALAAGAHLRVIIASGKF
ncbi:aldehyde dehydrogenase family protein, partial [Halomonas sp. 707D7]|uniref:aldehyde dehydrogenase family protein n=1 Tax=Halomonas sp. 707D7 TaxID=1681044 RepID=UPI00209F90AF